jgi:hypothetical protein
MNTMHHMLMPEILEARYAERLADAATQRMVREAAQASRPTRSPGHAIRFHLPRLRRSSSAGTI